MNPGQNYITANDVANYVVCPEAWRLKLSKIQYNSDNQIKKELGKQERLQWSNKALLYQRVRTYAKLSLILLFILTSLVFILEKSRSKFLYTIISKYKLKYGIPDESTNNPFLSYGLPEELVGFILILGLIIFMWDFFERRKNSLSKEVGLKTKQNTLAIKGSEENPTQELISKEFNLSSIPDAIIRDKGSMIAVDYHPFAKKIKDRHVAQLLVHLKLIELATKKRPEYGIIILGKDKREVKLINSEEKQKWLQSLLDEMNSILKDGVPAVAQPSFYKCKSCDVNSFCAFSAFKLKDGEYNTNDEEKEE